MPRDTGEWTDSAEINPGPGEPPGGKRGQLSGLLMRMMMILADTDGDGVLSPQEIQSVRARVFRGGPPTAVQKHRPPAIDVQARCCHRRSAGLLVCRATCSAARRGLHIYDDDWTIDTKKYRWREAGPDAATGVAAFGSVSKLGLTGAPT